MTWRKSYWQGGSASINKRSVYAVSLTVTFTAKVDVTKVIENEICRPTCAQIFDKIDTNQNIDSILFVFKGDNDAELRNKITFTISY